MTKFISFINTLVLSVSVVAGLTDRAGIAVAGIAIYLTVKEI